MKRKIFIRGFILSMITTIVIVQSCNNLDLQPLDRVSTTTFYKTPADFDGAIFAAYSSIQDIWGTSTETLNERGEYWSLSLTTTDDVEVNAKAGDSGSDYNNARSLDNLFIRSADTPYAALYTQIYKGILRANLVIEATENGQNSLSAEKKKSIVGEAKFLRAFFHFLALQAFGTPPLVTEVKKDLASLAVGNSTKDALYAAILKDFQDAFTGLPGSWDASNTGRVTKYAARAYEGKVNVWKKDWAAAITAFEDVRKNGPFKLMASYEDNFAFTKENNAESIFEIQYGGPYSDDNLWVFDDTHSEAFKASQGTGRVWYWNPSGDAGSPAGGLGWFIPTKNLVDEFEKGDARLTASIYQGTEDFYNRGDATPSKYDPSWSSSGFSIKKYFGKLNAVPAAYSPNNQAGFNNERYYRYGEMVLLYAEALIESGKTADGITVINNEIRKRAGLGATKIADAKKALQHERRCELAFEPHRWYDITRWGIGKEVFGAKWDDKFNVFPFPQSEISRSGGLLKQNPGY
jgi:starch-binding outer membrane protein, SusD/RagB family